MHVCVWANIIHTLETHVVLEQTVRSPDQQKFPEFYKDSAVMWGAFSLLSSESH